MTTILHINSSIRSAGSVSRQLSTEFVGKWKAAKPDDVVIERDLAPTDCGFQGMAKGSTTMAVRGACGAGRIVVENDAYREVEGCVIIRNANVTVVNIHWALPPSVKSAASCDAAQQ